MFNQSFRGHNATRNLNVSVTNYVQTRGLSECIQRIKTHLTTGKRLVFDLFHTCHGAQGQQGDAASGVTQRPDEKRRSNDTRLSTVGSKTAIEPPHRIFLLAHGPCTAMDRWSYNSRHSKQKGQGILARRVGHKASINSGPANQGSQLLHTADKRLAITQTLNTVWSVVCF